MDALSEFLAGLTPADVERERLAPLSKARLETFGGRQHRVMLAAHDMHVFKFRIAMHGAHQIPVAKPVKPKYRQTRRTSTPVKQFTSAQIDAALQALQNRKAS